MNDPFEGLGIDWAKVELQDKPTFHGLPVLTKYDTGKAVLECGNYFSEAKLRKVQQ